MVKENTDRIQSIESTVKESCSVVRYQQNSLHAQILAMQNATSTLEEVNSQRQQQQQQIECFITIAADGISKTPKKPAK
ncbi:hypothetical protein PS15m_006690 [Mucor circinelloides]